MEDSGRPRRRKSVRLWMGGMLVTLATAAAAQSVTVSPRWQVSYQAAADRGSSGESTAVPVTGDCDLVAVVVGGADGSRPAVRMGGRQVAVRVIGHDPVSRLGFYKVDGGLVPKPMVWLDEAGTNASASLTALAPEGPVNCRTTGWVKQVGGKVLPLALLKVGFERSVPPAGTPLVDGQGRVAAIMFQAAGGGTTGYAIPAEAVHRVRRDICGSRGQLVRGWLGLTLRAETQAARIVRVLEGSPAAAAGIRPEDVLLRVGQYAVNDYADAANAFFYLVPGQPVDIRLRRGTQTLDFKLTPTPPQAK